MSDTDDTAALQAAIDRAGIVDAIGVIYLSPRTYCITKTLVMTNAASFETIGALRDAILRDLDNGESAADIAKSRGVTKAAALELCFAPERVSLCRGCTASGRINAERCSHCGGLGYTTGVKL